jgi:hypothetical protein
MAAVGDTIDRFIDGQYVVASVCVVASMAASRDSLCNAVSVLATQGPRSNGATPSCPLTRGCATCRFMKSNIGVSIGRMTNAKKLQYP